MPYQVTVANPLPTGVPYVQLPNGQEGQAGAVYILSDEEAGTLNPALAADGLITVALMQTSLVNESVTLTSSQINTATYDVVTTAPTATSPYGYSTSAQAAAIVTSLNEVIAAYNQLQADVAALNAKLAG